MPRSPKPSTRKPKMSSPAAMSPEVDRIDSPRTQYINFPNRVAGVRVTEDTALTLGAVYACVRVISEDLAGLPWRVMEKRPGGGSIDRPEDPADWLLQTQSSPETPAFQFRETILAHALTWGNGYAEIERDGAGRPHWLWILTPDRVCVDRAADGRVVYTVRNSGGTAPTVLEAEDVFHLRGLGFDGLVGYSVIQLAARSIGTGIALDQSTADLFANDSTPGGILKHPGRLSKPARDNLREGWDKRHQGPQNRRRVAILEEGMSWEQTGLPPGDAQLIEQRQFTPADICRWFRVKPHKIADLSRSTFSNIESENTSHVIDTLMPWARRLETEANIKLFGRTNRGLRYSKLNFNAFLRGDIASRNQFYNSMLDRGVFCINDVLSLEDRNPIGPDGDKRFVQVNMQLLETAGEDPPAPVQPAGPVAQDPEPDPAEPEESQPMRSALRPVVEDAFRRLLRAESERAKAAIRNGPDWVGEWFEKLRASHATHIANAIRPAAAALALAGGIPSGRIDAAVGVVSARHLEGFRLRVAAAVKTPTVQPNWESLAGAMAADFIARFTFATEVAR